MTVEPFQELVRFDNDFKRELEDEYYYDKICERVNL